MPSVTIGGTQPEAVLDITTGGASGGTLGKATIVVGATQQNKSIGSGELVEITRAGTVEFVGYTTARPARTSEGTLEIEALDTRYELKEESVNRVFYDMDSGAIVRDLVEQRANALDERTVHRGDLLDDWSSDAPEFELCNISSRQLNDYGSDLLFVGFPEGTEGSYSATYTAVPDRAIPGDGQLLQLLTRVLENDAGDQITLIAELRDRANNSYVWEIDGRTTFETHELLAEEASADGELTTPGTFEYRFEITGKLADNLGIAIDHAAVVPFDLQPRDTELTTNGVQTTGRSITRRVEKGALELLTDLETEDGYLSYADADNDLHYEPAGEQVDTLEIVEGETLITDAQFATDYNEVSNKVIVKGAEGVQVTRRDPASIRYYGLSERAEPLVDRELQTTDEAADRGEGFLAENAWLDTVATFEIGDTDYEAVRSGQTMPVEWPSQGLSGTFKIEDKEVSAAGVVTVSLGARL